MRTNIVAASVGSEIIAPLQYDGSTDHDIFEIWFERMLLPKLAKNTTVVMDNATFHRKKVLHMLARKARCNVMFLPPYSPDLNPIEKTWANLKEFLRSYSLLFSNLQNAVEDYFKTKWLYLVCYETQAYMSFDAFWSEVEHWSHIERSFRNPVCPFYDP